MRAPMFEIPQPPRVDMTKRKPLPDLRRVDRRRAEVLRKVFANDLYALIEARCTVMHLATSARLDYAAVLALTKGEETKRDVTVLALHRIAEEFLLQIVFRIDDDREIPFGISTPVEEVFGMGVRPVFVSAG